MNIMQPSLSADVLIGTQTLELDIQNISNAQSVVYDYRHPNKEIIEEGYQWALSPVINYRIEF
ncbi:hypothetical protein [Carboxylicivirga marina]|uniref:TonB-dependent receptor-like beta-barrel domain-containing protein n=2 Tax=Carboxylicivirga TaxID=1628153 RepID=A0ABS1HKB6_9BACT|nr:hypothetical protein [Carboxylicivirga marina]MBK3517594.1 hypothetical protein [Carboxylicivirga marina]